MNKVTVHASERIDDLLTNDLKIIQSDEVFSFSMDAVLLGRFSYVPPRGRIADLCTGNGVIPLLLSTRTKASITGVEIQERLADMAERNVQINGLEHQIRIVNGDLKEISGELGHGSFDVVTVNPPYLPVPSGEQNVNEHVAAARHEVFCTLEDVVKACSRLVRSGGRVAMVHRPSRLVEIFCTMRQYKLEPKRVRFVHPRAGEEANMVLIEALRDGKPEVRTLPPLIVYKNKTDYCDELMEIYYGRREQLVEPSEGIMRDLT
ncbi:tRNA1(Val) (adenine(37)-N6)-methyltransferase [Paenibacillus doosanensis]|uniref:N5-glutamine S-adenosyl-L-methionine-dependent methyltransferase n=1 Tax=Paenibacillus konkukensis TaxID=2020716 RepID=A0ABY4RS74_9BACL|nr:MULTISPECIES: tRNA1(Val) (adenine(37)-N6)-methyltransferase [Paenibacillus]MCS7463222.1 tRNA1(Val) (adenine(37)-N6)-methyltransferase [Paenibacillus doosanensis]UQZ84890.1 N5-glutamine S-adenosyl-L-methionine-dependent methyltransferase [Paenibacillus konkukensis]